MSRGLVTIAALLAIAGCAGTARRAEDPISTAVAPSLRLLLSSGSAPTSSRRELGQGEGVRPGDSLALSVQVRHPTYLYAVWYSPAGESELLFPAELPRVPVAPSTIDIAIPGSEQLHGGQTLVQLYVVASAAPLDTALCALLRLRCQPAPGQLTGRGDDNAMNAKSGKTTKKGDEKKGNEKQVSDPKPPARAAQPRTSKPPEERGNARDAALGFAGLDLSGVHPRAVVIPVVVNYQPAN